MEYIIKRKRKCSTLGMLFNNISRGTYDPKPFPKYYFGREFIMFSRRRHIKRLQFRRHVFDALDLNRRCLKHSILFNIACKYATIDYKRLDTTEKFSLYYRRVVKIIIELTNLMKMQP